MAHNAANSQRPSRADSARQPSVGDADPHAMTQAGATQSADRVAHQPTRNVASPPPGQNAHLSTGYRNTHSHHYQQPPLGHQPGNTFQSYGALGPVDGYAYGSHSYHAGRHSQEHHHYPRPPSRNNSQSSGSGSAPSPHDALNGPHYAPHYSPSYPAYPSYPGAYYPSPAASAPTNAPTSHQPYQQGPAKGSSPYGMQASHNFAPSYPYQLHPNHYGPPPSHPSHSHNLPASGRGPWSGPAQGGMHSTGPYRDNSSSGSGGSRRQSSTSGRPGSIPQRTSPNSAGHPASPHQGTAALPPRPSAAPVGTRSEQAEAGALPSQSSDLGVADLGTAVSVAGTDLDTEGDTAPSDMANAERVPGSGLRPHYHPQQGPRSDFVLWCGNVPQDATVEELWEVFSRLTPVEYHNWSTSTEGQEQAGDLAEPDVEGHGVLSIFIISRSNCAFVNYASPAHLERAVKYFNGKQVRPHDPRCPKLVCRVRKKDDEAQAGVAGQRGRGMHVAWLKQQRELERSQTNGPSTDETPPRPPTETLPTPQKESNQVATGLASASYSSSGSTSYASTNSSLFRHPAFRHRFFILKSLRADDLDRSIETGYWATQPHNENVLDQAYRNSETVFLIFGVNQTGQFHGYAKMAGPIHTSTETKNKDEPRRASTASDGLHPITIPESPDKNGRDPGATLSSATSPSDSSLKRAHPTLDKGDIEAAKGLFGTLSVDGPGGSSNAAPMLSPLPLSPTVEESGFVTVTSPQRNDTVTPRNAGSIAQSSTWPYTATRGNTATEGNTLERPKLAATLSDETPAARSPAEQDEHGVRRIDMEAESPQTNSSQSEQPSLAPSDSVSWSSADPRVAEQVALRAVIHNLRLDEMESRGQAEILESQLRSASNDTDATLIAKGSEQPTQDGGERSPPRQSSSDSWGKPFRVEWIRTDPLPFQRVKKLRNPWRDNRQVKVSRDGTELEPGVGRQLLEEWNRSASAATLKSSKPSQSSDTPPTPAGRANSDEDE